VTYDLVKRLRDLVNDDDTEMLAWEAADRIEEMQRAIVEWQFAIVDWEGIDFVDRIEDEKSRKIIEDILEAYVKNDSP
jgi:hypothetical protein